jgi:rhodanese-related sulfurtransferase
MNGFNHHSTMAQVETAYPFARALLHSKFHVGGCASCGFEPNETISEVAQKHGKDADAMVEVLNTGLKDMQESEVDPTTVARMLESSPNDVLLVDVREPWEYEICRLSENALLLNEKSMPIIFEKGAKAKEVVVYCHHGVRSLNAALYMRQNGLPHARSLRGGIDQYSKTANPSIPRY